MEMSFPERFLPVRGWINTLLTDVTDENYWLAAAGVRKSRALNAE